MKRVVLHLIIGIALMMIGFVGGSFYQDAKVGYHFKVIEKKTYESAVGTIQWIHGTESIGRGFLDPDTTMIILGDRTIYKAKRDFQESSPFVQDVKINGNSIEWTDGISHFHLTVSDEKLTRQ
jgi:hypothetical protein